MIKEIIDQLNLNGRIWIYKVLNNHYIYGNKDKQEFL